MVADSRSLEPIGIVPIAPSGRVHLSEQAVSSRPYRCFEGIGDPLDVQEMPVGDVVGRRGAAKGATAQRHRAVQPGRHAAAALGARRVDQDPPGGHLRRANRSMRAAFELWMIAVWPAPAIVSRVWHSRSPSSSPSTVNIDRTGASFSPVLNRSRA